MNTRDLTSYIPGYDSYCNQQENERVERILNEREDMEEKITNYGYLIDDIEGVLEEKTTMNEKLTWINDLIKDFRKENSWWQKKRKGKLEN